MWDEGGGEGNRPQVTPTFVTWANGRWWNHSLTRREDRKCSWGQTEVRVDDEIIGSELDRLWYIFGSFWSWHSLFLYFPWKLETSMTFPREPWCWKPRDLCKIGRSGWRRDDTQWYNFASLLQRFTKTIQPLILSPSTPGNGSFAGKPSCIIIIGFSISIMGDILHQTMRCWRPYCFWSCSQSKIRLSRIQGLLNRFGKWLWAKVPATWQSKLSRQ